MRHEPGARVVACVWGGTAGVVSMGIVNLFTALPPHAHPVRFPAEIILMVGGLANVCYLLGPMVEFGIERVWRGRVLPAGPTLYRMGLTFSTGLVLFPSLIAGLDWIYRIVRTVF